MKRLGAWPGEAHYDPSRPSILPYWIDTPAESAVKYGLWPASSLKDPPAPLTAPAPSAPKTAAEMKNWTPARQLEADRAAWAEWAKDPFANQPKTGPDDFLLYLGLFGIAAGAFLAFRR